MTCKVVARPSGARARRGPAPGSPWGVCVRVLLACTLLCTGARAAPPPVVTEAIDARARHEVLERLAQRLEALYVFPGMGQRLAAAVRQKDRSNAYRTLVSGPELARALTADLYAIAHDKHLTVQYVFGPMPRPTTGPARLPAPLAELLRDLNGLIPKVEILDGNVGYMRVDGVPPLEVSRDPMAAAFAFVHRTAALIIDNRTNAGGDEEAVALFISYLSDGPPRLVESLHGRNDAFVKQYMTTDLGALSYGAHKPVFVLTSAGTFSAGEALSYDLQALKRAVIVGEVTAGGAHGQMGVPLGHQMAVSIPFERLINPITGTNWEGVGVKPDVAVPAAAALTQAYHLAVERLLARPADPARRSNLEALEAKLDTLAQAAAGGAPAIPAAQLTGTYTLLTGAGPAVTIIEDDGELVQRVPGQGDVALVRTRGNRYAQRGQPQGSFSSFRLKDGRPELVIERPVGPPTLREKAP